MPLSRFDNGKRVAGTSDGLPVNVALKDRDVYAFLHMDSPFVRIKENTDESVYKKRQVHRYLSSDIIGFNILIYK